MAAAAVAVVSAVPPVPRKIDPPPFDTEYGRKLVPSKMHKTIHFQINMVNLMCTHISKLDAMLYSEDTRRTLFAKLPDGPWRAHLMDPVATRNYMYRFHLKGGNSLFLMVKYLQHKYGTLFPSTIGILPEGDWDTSLYICPECTDDEFDIVLKTVIPRVLKEMIECSIALSRLPEYYGGVVTALDTAVDYLKGARLSEYLDYTYKYLDKKGERLYLFGSSKTDPELQTLCGALPKSGEGTVVTSNPEPFEGSAFYLARILANVYANHRSGSHSVRMPVELLDFSIPYKSEHLTVGWESYSEYHVNMGVYNLRVLSPVSLYVDIQKCLERDAQNVTRTNKMNRRKERIRKIIEEMVSPHNTVIQNNIRRHATSRTYVGDRVRQLLIEATPD
jgi:hypothetical protein